MKLFEPGGLLILLVVVLVIFGPTQLPKIAKMVGQSSKALRDGMDGKLDDDEAAPSHTDATPADHSAE